MNKKINKEEYIKIKKNILKKLYPHSAFSRGHLLYETLITGIPPHLKGCVRLVLDDLLREKIILIYAKIKYGKAYQLNIKKLKEIEEFIF